MLKKTKYGNFELDYKEGNVRYDLIFMDFINYRLSVVKLFRSQNKTKVMLIEYEKNLYVLKVFKPNGKKIEKLYKNFFRKDYYLNLTEKNAEVWERGMRFQNDVYLLARRKKKYDTDLYVMLFEYIPGTLLDDLSEISEKIKKEVICKMELLHQHNLVSGDAHKGNFILSQSGLRIIDLSGKNFTRSRVVEDWLMLEKHLNIPFSRKGFTHHLLKMKSKIRKKIKNLKNLLLRCY